MAAVVLRNISGMNLEDICVGIQQQALAFFGLGTYDADLLMFDKDKLVAHESGDGFVVEYVTVSCSAEPQRTSESEALVPSYSTDAKEYVTTPYNCLCPDFEYRKLGTAMVCKHQVDEYGDHCGVAWPGSVINMATEGKKIMAIKLLRENNKGMSLMEAKLHVDAFLAREEHRRRLSEDYVV